MMEGDDEEEEEGGVGPLPETLRQEDQTFEYIALAGNSAGQAPVLFQDYWL